MNNFYNLGTFNSGSLTAIIISYRTLGINKELAKNCMAELARRRDLGDDFEYENYIEQEVKTFPTSDINLNKILKIKKSII